jgi:hypothetical protein
MAGEALSFLIERLMRRGCLHDVLLLVRVTSVAEIAISIRLQVVLEVPAVGTMAVHTRVLHRGVGKLRALGGLGFVRVAGEADIVPFRHKKPWVITLVGGVAGAAASRSNRTVHEFAAGHGFVMATKAELASSGAELEFVRGLMRIMALGALTFLYRRMDDLLSGHLFVALVTELADIGYRRERMLACLLMTGITFAPCYGSMDELVLPHGGVTFCGYTGLLCFIFLGKGAAIVTVRYTQEQHCHNGYQKKKFLSHRVESSFNI